MTKFAHNGLDILVCNAGIMDVSPQLSKDGFELEFAVNHLGNALVFREMRKILLDTA